MAQSFVSVDMSKRCVERRYVASILLACGEFGAVKPYRAFTTEVSCGWLGRECETVTNLDVAACAVEFRGVQ